MATKKTAAPKTAVTKAAATPVAKPLKDTFNKSSLLAHLVTQTELDKKTVQTVLQAQAQTVAGEVAKAAATTESTLRQAA